MLFCSCVAIQMWRGKEGTGTVNWALLNLWKYLLAWIGSCGHADEEQADVKGNLRGGGLWLVASCNRAAPDASSFLKEGGWAEWNGGSRSSWMISTGWGESSWLSVDFWQVLVVPIEIATSVEPVLGAGVRVGAQLEPPEWHQGRLKPAEFTNFVLFRILPLMISAQSRTYNCFWSWIKSNQTHLHLCTALSHRNKSAPPVCPCCCMLSHLVDHSSSFLALSFLAVLCFSSSLSFSVLASSTNAK